ncbi:putative NAC domain-containing protein-like [Capsicum annuum]|nr:putative NAC domain-containing protein-like [Capsicum annuum]
MATPSVSRVPPKPSANSPLTSTLKAYFIPFILFSASLVYQLIVIPRAFPPSHYDALGITPRSSIEEVNQAYEKLSSKWNSGVEVPSTIDFIKVRYAFELLTNHNWKRDYDLFSIDEQFHVIEKAKEQYAGRSISEITFPLLETIPFGPEDHAVDVINSENFLSKLETDKALLIQVEYMWQTVTLLDGVANTGVIDLADVQLATYLAEKRPGIPALVAFSPGCRSFRCMSRHEGELSIDSVTDWVATSILSLPRIRYYSKESMAQDFLLKSKPHKLGDGRGCGSPPSTLRLTMRLWWVMFRWFHTPWVMPRTMKDLMRRGSVGKQREKAEKTKHLKHGFDSINVVASIEFDRFLVLFNDKVKVIFFSQTGERATPFIRQAAKNYSAVATFAFVLWQEGESSLWWNMLGVESAPAIVFLKETGYVNSSLFVDIMEKNKHQVLPQLRSVTSKELGCDARGFSRAGKDTKIWYCVVLVGRYSLELNTMRETMRRVQETLSKDGELTAVDQDLSSAPALLALKQKRLTFTWLDGEAQKSYCFFYINSEDSYETCGPRDMIDTAQLFIVRYDRNGTEDVGKQPTNKFSALYNVESDPASQLVAKYNGSNKIEEIVQWISEIIKDGDSKDLPSFKSRTPELVPEDADSSWSSWTQGTVSPSGGLNHRVKSLLNKIHDYIDDPRVGPFLLLAALISFGSVWFKRSQVAQSSKPNHSSQKSKEPEHLDHQTSEPDQSNQPNAKDVTMRKRRTRPRNDLVPPSMTDVDPKDAYQVEFSDSDTGPLFLLISGFVLLEMRVLLDFRRLLFRRFCPALLLLHRTPPSNTGGTSAVGIVKGRRLDFSATA